jgi:hypothetical protein
MARRLHCGDKDPHEPHTWYGPSERRGETKQIQFSCPGTPKKRKDKLCSGGARNPRQESISISHIRILIYPTTISMKRSTALPMCYTANGVTSQRKGKTMAQQKRTPKADKIAEKGRKLAEAKAQAKIEKAEREIQRILDEKANKK